MTISQEDSNSVGFILLYALAQHLKRGVIDKLHIGKVKNYSWEIQGDCFYFKRLFRVFCILLLRFFRHTLLKIND